jgi:hypothetical protein
MRVLISGGSGMIGTALTKSLLSKGNHVWVLTRNPMAVHVPKGATAVGWDGRTSAGWGELAGQMDAVVNLVGERLSKWPWTKGQKQRFWESRVEGGHAIVEAFQAASTPPKVLIQASGVNYYGPRGQERVTEADEPGKDFLSRLSLAWEGSTESVEKLGTRRVVIRSAIVLSAREGILPIMMFPVRAFVGGPLGSGRQGLPWIHLVDEVDAMLFLMENQNASGPFNLTAPDPISSAEFMRLVAKSLQRPYWMPAPAFAMRMILGEMSTLVLEGAYLLPKRLLELGFNFRFVNAQAALEDLLKG